jgi:curved DNA-binding protein CbpA
MKLYVLLGIELDATPEQIKTAYRKMAQVNHPDKGGDVELFQAIQNAYEVLSDPERRAKYDETGDDTRAPDVQSEALAAIGEMLIKLIDTCDFETENLIGSMRNAVSGKRMQAESKKLHIENMIERRKKAMDRITMTEDGPNVMHQIVQSAIDNATQQLKVVDHFIGVTNRIDDILDDYLYSTDAAKAKYGTFNGFLFRTE